MTPLQIKKLLNATGFAEDLQHIEISRDAVEIYVPNNDESTDALMERVCATLRWSGYRTGYGSWVLQKEYVSLGDWNDKTSKWHY